MSMFKLLKKERWSPYKVGVCIGVLAIVSLFGIHKTIGTSTTFVKMAGFILSVINPSAFEQNLYYQDYLKNKAWIDWQAMLVFGIFIGAYISRKLSKPNATYKLPSLWEKNFGASKRKRYIAAFSGGIIVMFGARLAGGCTSGHAISGGFQLAVSGWLFMLSLFALAIPTALLLYRKK